MNAEATSNLRRQMPVSDYCKRPDALWRNPKPVYHLAKTNPRAKELNVFFKLGRTLFIDLDNLQRWVDEEKNSF